jgi:hypothetical protein
VTFQPRRVVAWATDIHLNFASPERRTVFHAAVRSERPHALLLGGDIHEAPGLVEQLRALETDLRVPIFFVLGNHDYYRSTFDRVEARMRALSRESPALRWLPDAGVIELSPEVGLVGHGGWADGRNGDYWGSNLELSDDFLIGDFLGLGQRERLALLGRRADEAAAWARREIPAALERFRRLIVLTHVPPFQEAAWYEGKMSHPHYLPHFSSRVMGEALAEAARAHPDREILVLCGHTHGGGILEVLPNLTVVTGASRYGHPEVTGIIDLEAPRLLPARGAPP